MGSQTLTAFDTAIVVLYFAITIYVGLRFASRWKGSEDFFLAGRSLTWPVIGLSLFATNISTEHFVGLAAGGYREGFVQGGYEWIASYCLLMLAAVFAPQYLKHKVFTIPEFFERRYGVELRVSLTIYFLAMIILTKTSVAFYSGTVVLVELTKWDFQTTLWGVGIVTAIYTMVGGLAAVVYTDAIQALILIAGSTVLTAMGLHQVGGWEGLTSKLVLAGKADLLSMVKGPTDGLPFSGFLLGNFLVGGMFYWCMDQVNVQRVLGAKNVREARFGALFAGFLKIIPVFILVLPGVIAAALWTDIADPNKTYSILVTRLLPAGLRGLVLAALLAALMSSVSAMFNSASTLVARDLLARFRPETPARKQIWVGQAALVLVMVGGILVTPAIGYYEHVWAYLQEITGYLSVPFAVVGLCGIFFRRANKAGALAAVAAGIVAGAVLLWDTHWGGIFTSPYLTSFMHRNFLCAIISFVSLVVVSLRTTPPSEAVLGGGFQFRMVPGEGETAREFRLARGWMFVLLALVTWLWWAFR
jgi:solute:Na+ symporter, SSS family